MNNILFRGRPYAYFKPLKAEFQELVKERPLINCRQKKVVIIKKKRKLNLIITMSTT